jgi:hypothetical protein
MINLEKSFEDALQKLLSSLLETLHVTMISNYEETLIAALSQLLIDGQWEDISRMYRLQALVIYIVIATVFIISGNEDW